jgi:hypothetical protein
MDCHRHPTRAHPWMPFSGGKRCVLSIRTCARAKKNKTTASMLTKLPSKALITSDHHNAAPNDGMEGAQNRMAHLQLCPDLVSPMAPQQIPRPDSADTHAVQLLSCPNLSMISKQSGTAVLHSWSTPS